MRAVIKNFVTILIVILMTSCGGLAGTKVVKHPDAPMVITDSGINKLRVSIYDSGSNELIDYGWIKSSEAVGWTLHKYDWESYINGHTILDLANAK